MNTDDDAVLVEAFLTGRPMAADDFVRRFRPRVLTLLAVARVPMTDRDDVAQNAMHHMMTALTNGRFHRRSSLATWVYAGVARHVATYRRQSRRIDRAMPAQIDRVRIARWETPEALVLIREILATLRPSHRELFDRVELHGEPVAVVASSLGLSTRSGYAILHAIQTTLREALLDRPTDRPTQSRRDGARERR